MPRNACLNTLSARDINSGRGSRVGFASPKHIAFPSHASAIEPLTRATQPAQTQNANREIMNIANSILNSVSKKFEVVFSGAKFLFALLGGATMSVAAQTQPLNDTGVIVCVGPSAPCDPALHKRQDAMTGRDAARRSPGSGLTTNTDKGFSYTKISRTGAVLPDSAVLGDTSTSWSCTRDNVTGLLWEVKLDNASHFRHYTNTYSWYDPDASKNGGYAGIANGGSCNVTGRCDTQKYVQDLNTSSLCGRTNWRLPNIREVHGLIDYGSPDNVSKINSTFFSRVGLNDCGAFRNHSWTSTTAASDSSAAAIMSFVGVAGYLPKNASTPFNYVCTALYSSGIWAVS